MAAYVAPRHGQPGTHTYRHDGTSPLPLGMDAALQQDEVWDWRRPNDRPANASLPCRGSWSYRVSIGSWTTGTPNRGSPPQPNSKGATVYYRVSVFLQSPIGNITCRRILRRFSDFMTLKDALNAGLRRLSTGAHGIGPREKKLPEAPPKLASGLRRVNAHGELVEERRRALELWMWELLADLDVARSAQMAAFLELEALAREGAEAEIEAEALWRSSQGHAPLLQTPAGLLDQGPTPPFGGSTPSSSGGGLVTPLDAGGSTPSSGGYTPFVSLTDVGSHRDGQNAAARSSPPPHWDEAVHSEEPSTATASGDHSVKYVTGPAGAPPPAQPVSEGGADGDTPLPAGVRPPPGGLQVSAQRANFAEAAGGAVADAGYKGAGVAIGHSAASGVTFGGERGGDGDAGVSSERDLAHASGLVSLPGEHSGHGLRGPARGYGSSLSGEDDGSVYGGRGGGVHGGGGMHGGAQEGGIGGGGRGDDWAVGADHSGIFAGGAGKVIALPASHRAQVVRLLAVLHRRMATLRSDLDDGAARLASETAVKEFLAAKVKDLEAELHKARGDAKAALKDAIERERAAASNLAWELEEARAAQREAEDKCGVEAGANAALLERVTAAEGEAAAARDKCAAAEAEAARVSQDAREAVVRVEAEKEALAQEVRALARDKQALEQRLVAVERERDALAKRVADMDKERAWVRRDRAGIMAEVDALRKRLKECAVDHLLREDSQAAVSAGASSSAGGGQGGSAKLASANLELLAVSDSRIGCLIAEANLLAEFAEPNGGGAAAGRGPVEGSAEERDMEAALRRAFAEILIDNAQLRKATNSLTRTVLCTAEELKADGPAPAPPHAKEGGSSHFGFAAKLGSKAQGILAGQHGGSANGVDAGANSSGGLLGRFL